MREQGTSFCVGTPAECIRFLELYEALGIEEVILLCAIGPAQHQEVLHTIRLFGEQMIPHFQAKEFACSDGATTGISKKEKRRDDRRCADPYLRCSSALTIVLHQHHVQPPRAVRAKFQCLLDVG